MNYRHAYHAGNFADVLKHATLALVIEHLKMKPAPFRVIDTHAGVGTYDLAGNEANKTGEWREGIARVIAAPKTADVAQILAPYLDAIRDGNPGEMPCAYPGSPLLARRLLRPDDRLLVNELHPEDAAQLQALFANDKQVKVSSMDGWTALKAFLPPKERRGVILIDPPFEQSGELDRLAEALHETVKRFATGILILWYPIKNLAPLQTFERDLKASGIPKILRIELLTGALSDPPTLSGTGLIVMNPPYTLEANMRKLLPFLVQACARSPAAKWNLDWLQP